VVELPQVFGLVEIIEIQCRMCDARFQICRSCWRGQGYCGCKCRKSKKRQDHCETQCRYRQTEKGKKTHREYERKRRKIREPKDESREKAELRKRPKETHVHREREKAELRVRPEPAEVASAKETHVHREREKTKFRVRPEPAEVAATKETHVQCEKTMADTSSSRQAEGLKVDIGVGKFRRAEDENPMELKTRCHFCKRIGVLVERFPRRSYFRIETPPRGAAKHGQR